MSNSSKNILWHPQGHIQTKDWTPWGTILDLGDEACFGREYMPRLVLDFTYYYIYEEWCSNHHPDVDTTRCIMAFLHYKVNANNKFGQQGQATANDYITNSQRHVWN